MTNVSRPHIWSIRLRLTLWFTAAMAVSLVIFSAAIYFAMERALNQQQSVAVQDGLKGLAENLKHEFDEGDSPLDAARSVIDESTFRNLIVEIYTPNQKLLASSNDFPEPVLGPGVLIADLPESPPVTKTISNPKFDRDGFEAAAVSVVHPLTGERYPMVIGGRKSSVTTELSALRTIIFSLAPILLLISAGAGYYLAKRALNPVAQMTRQARHMNAARLSERLHGAGQRDELGQLAQTFNELFDRIETSFEQMRRFIADASHELRTPVTVIRSETDVALTEPRRADEAFSSLEVIRDEATIMSRLVDDMFTLARADLDDLEILHVEDVDISELIRTCVRASETLGRVRDISVECIDDLPVPTVCRGDRIRWAQMLLNLLDNATKYTPSGGQVTATAKITEGPEQIVISIADNGPGIPPEAREAVFSRFYRLDKARTRTIPGSGLGLPIARRIAELSGGSLTLSEGVSGGCVFTITLPKPGSGGR